jgi:hypothetical protein
MRLAWYNKAFAPGEGKTVVGGMNLIPEWTVVL